MTPLLLVAVAVAGGIGSALRFAIDSILQRVLAGSLPVATAIINVTGSFALGLVTGLALGGLVPAEWQAVLGVGLLGGYTTFSTASLETVRLIQRGRVGAGVSIALGVLVLSVLAAAGGLVLGRLLLG